MRNLWIQAGLSAGWVAAIGLGCNGGLDKQPMTVAPGGASNGPIQRSPSGGVGEVTNGAANSAGQPQVETTPGGAQVMGAPVDPHSPEILRTHSPKLNVLDRQQRDLVDAKGVPADPTAAPVVDQ
jgi:hypothetical protein